MTHIIIADDHEVVRSGIRRVLDAQPDWEVVGEAENGLKAVELALRKQPHIAILGYGLPACNGVGAAKEIHSKLPKTEILIFTMHDHEDLVRDVLAAGARGYLLKSDANRLLVDAVRSLKCTSPTSPAKSRKRS
jgi:DNA-binding NarL/FixJ family response regulator